LAVNTFVATSTQWKLWYTARILFQENFKRNCTVSTGIPKLECDVKNDPIGLPESESDKKCDPGSWCC